MDPSFSEGDNLPFISCSKYKGFTSHFLFLNKVTRPFTKEGTYNFCGVKHDIDYNPTKEVINGYKSTHTLNY